MGKLRQTLSKQKPSIVSGAVRTLRFRQLTSSRIRQALAILLVAGIGYTALMITHAASTTSSAEAERGKLGGNASISADGSASGGKAVQFHAASSGGGGGSTSGGGGSGGGSGTGGGSSDYAQTVYDNFSGSSLNKSLWTDESQGSTTGSVSVSNGTLSIPLVANAETEIDATKYYNVDNGIWAIRWSHTGTGTVDTSGDSNAGTEAYFGLADRSDHYIEFQTFPPSNTWYALNATGKDNFSPPNQVTGNQNAFGSGWTANDFFGIGNYNINGDDYLHLYSSPDGVTWTEIGSVYAAGYVDFTNVELYIGTWQHNGKASWVSTFQDASTFTRH